MGQAVDSFSSGVHDSANTPATKVSQNMTVKTASGPIGLITDTLTFTGATVSGLWFVGSARVKINGTPIVHESSVGIGIAAAPPPPTTGPLQLGQSDSKVEAM